MLSLREKHEYEQEIADLKLRLRRATDGKCYYKRKCERAIKPKPRESKTSVAEKFVKAYHDGDRSLTFQQIGDLCFMSRNSVKTISYRLTKKLKAIDV